MSKYFQRIGVALACMSLVWSLCESGEEQLRPTDRPALVTVGKRGELRVNGNPFLPIFVWLQPIQNFDFLASLGINTFMGEGARGESPREFLDALHKRGLWGIIHSRNENWHLKDHPALLAWMFSDEPDLPATLPYERPVMVPQDEKGNINIWWEGELPKETNFPKGGWMEREATRTLLSGGNWLTLDANELPPEGAFFARYEVDVPQAARYTLWVREFIKSWASPTRWRFNTGEWQQTARDLKELEPQRVHRVLTVGWHRYGTVELTAGRHTFELIVSDRRTAGSPDKVGKEFMAGFDAFLLTTSDKAPLAPLRPPRPRISPEEIARQYAELKRADTSHPVYLNLTAGFFPKFARYDEATTGAIYPAYCRATDIIGYDLYPVTGWGRPDWVPLIAPVTRKLRELAPPHVPVWVILECTTKLRWVSQEHLNRIGRPKGATAAELRAMVWMAIINGAKGIGYFPHRWDPYKPCDISEELQAEMKRTNRQLTQLASVILGEDMAGLVGVEKVEGGPVEFIVRVAEEGGMPHLFMVNASTAAATIRLHSKEIKSMTDFESGETISVKPEGLLLKFEPLQVRIFVLSGLKK
ncbi:MAG: hypothetical protein RMK18_12320 [Armatimonadota bacterium]|nr:hypothetical protein [Armatimonadota bacterium]MDW8026631.1 hypothetical protein [Armatimonadota bacterium]